MRRNHVLSLLVGWLLGAGSILGWAAVTGGWYEYSVPESDAQLREMINSQGWEVIPGSQDPYLRRPRLRIYGVRPPILPAEPVRTTPAPAAGGSASKATPVPKRETVSLAGTPADQKTEPFLLAGGSYQIEWSASASSSRNCNFRAWLSSADESAKEIASRAISNGQTASGLALVYDVAPGEHYLDLTPLTGVSCRWTIVMAQR